MAGRLMHLSWMVTEHGKRHVKQNCHDRDHVAEANKNEWTQFESGISSNIQKKQTTVSEQKNVAKSPFSRSKFSSEHNVIMLP